MSDPVAHYAFQNTALLCSYCSWAMYSDSDFTVEPFVYIVQCTNTTCPHVGIKYRVPREQGVKLERI